MGVFCLFDAAARFFKLVLGILADGGLCATIWGAKLDAAETRGEMIMLQRNILKMGGRAGLGRKNTTRSLLAIFVFLSVVLAGSTDLFGQEITQNKIGFLVIAPDRGFSGNQEIEAVVGAFKRDYPAALALVGSKYDGIESEYSAYIRRAIEALNAGGVTEIVALPLFFSATNPVLKKVTLHLPSYAAGEGIRWAAPMRESYLTAQILLDRVEAMSRDPKEERLVVLGIGAVDEEDEKVLRNDLEAMTGYVQRYLPLKETRIGIYYDRDAEADLRKKKNEAVDDLVIRTAAKKGKTLVVPFFIGPKFSARMSMTSWLKREFEELDVLFDGEEIFPHPNILLWLKKTANQYLPAKSAEIGVVIMPHGATRPWNDAVERAIAPIKSRYQIEMAYGMGDAGTIAKAISRLEERGVRRIIFVRMYALSHHLKETTDYLLGKSDIPPPHFAEKDLPPPAQIRSAAVFSTFGGYEEDPAIAEILHDRIMEISKEPSRETVILVAHGSGTDERDAAWLKVMNKNVDRIKRMVKSPFRNIIAATVREDWPEKRKEAVAHLKTLIREGNRNGRVLLIANRLYGAGPYERFLEEEAFVLNGKGFAPHPKITHWLERGIDQAVREIDRESGALVSATRQR
ncbi:MAG: hypothetical protein ACE5HN_02030 [Nitrospiria bacterium]